MREDVSKKLKSVRLWFLILLVSASMWIFVFYCVALPTKEETFTLWVGAESYLKEEIQTDIKAVCGNYGLRECKITSYSPTDTYYATAFYLQSRTVDIYILSKSEAEEKTTSNIVRFRSAESFGYKNAFVCNDVACGLPFKGDYCIFVNYYSEKSDVLLQDVIELLVAYGGETE